ncbi:MAG: hypothetical protein CMC98_01615, partial [Flavobacteriales bacterium]|nr:hypothetical protein [Flavobacteriales bacterium]
MDFYRIKLLFNTVKYLKFEQITYRVLYALRRNFVNKEYSYELKESVEPLKWSSTLEKHTSYIGNFEFHFLNITHNFEHKIDWNYNGHGKLWTYNLNYFDFLNQLSIKQSEALVLMQDYVERFDELKDGLEPYPTSLRGINWIKYLSKVGIQDEVINTSLYNQYLILLDNLEYHILGNHLLENGFSLLFAAYYFKNDKFYSKSKHIIEKELNEQILNDGAHFELSPMYHQIILERIFDCLWLIKINNYKHDIEFVSTLKCYSEKMLSWLNKVTFRDGSIPMVNDSTYGISSNTSSLVNYSKKFNIDLLDFTLSDSGYRKFKNKLYELFIDVGKIGPSYQSGHAHADTFSFILHTSEPVIVDPGISTYNIGKVRDSERATINHNTVSIENKNSSQVWSGFRVGNRANVILIKDNKESLIAEHDGYKNINSSHKREFFIEKSKINIKDTINKSLKGKASFHFHPNVEIEVNLLSQEIIFNTGKISFKGSIKIEKFHYDYSQGFNKKMKATKIEVSFIG